MEFVWLEEAVRWLESRDQEQRKGSVKPEAWLTEEWQWDEGLQREARDLGIEGRQKPEAGCSCRRHD